MTDHDRLDQLDRLLHDITRDRAGPPPPAPPSPVVDHLRARGRGRRRRRARAAVVAGVAAVALGLLGATRLADRPGGTERIDAVDTGSTTTVGPSPETTGGPAIGAPASAYVGVAIVQDPEDGDVWTAGGRSLGYITTQQAQVGLPGGRSVLEARDGARLLLWLLDGTWPGPSTILDAVEAPAGSDLAGGCSATGTDREVVAVIASSPTDDDDPTVVAAWTVGPDDRLAARPDPSDVTCAGLPGA